MNNWLSEVRDLKWYYILGIVVGVVALVATIVYLVKTYDLLARLPFTGNNPDEIED